MNISKLKLEGIFLIEPEIQIDSRGSFMESFRKDALSEYFKKEFVQDNLVESNKGVLRGLHFQLDNPQDKLVQVLDGEIFDVAVDIRKKSSTYGKWFGISLSCKNKKQLLVPAGYAHGYCVLSETAKVLYKCTEYYCPEDQHGYIWNDATLNINWPIKNPKISIKDSKLQNFKK